MKRLIPAKTIALLLFAGACFTLQAEAFTGFRARAMGGHRRAAAPAGASCATSAAPNFSDGGACNGTGVNVTLPHGCTYLRESNFAGGFFTSTAYVCNNGAWVAAPGGPDNSDINDDWENWSDSCGGTSNHYLQCT